MIRCKECKFWDCPEDRGLPVIATMHDCRINPPQLAYQVYGQTGIWPMTTANASCGQGKPLPKQNNSES